MSDLSRLSFTTELAPGVESIDLGIAGVSVVTTTRVGGCSQGAYQAFNLATHVNDAAEAVIANRARLQQVIEPATEVLWLNQVHGSQVVSAEQSGSGVTADASYTTKANKACAILTADCLPVVIAAVDGSGVAVAHAGWRGLAGGVLEATLTALSEANGNLPTSSMRAWLGPCIGASAFEVGAEVRAAFLQSQGEQASACFTQVSGAEPHGHESTHYLGDLAGIAVQRLVNVGVEDVLVDGRCTVANPETYFSYRRDGQTGRMATLAWLNR